MPNYRVISPRHRIGFEGTSGTESQRKKLTQKQTIKLRERRPLLMRRKRPGAKMYRKGNKPRKPGNASAALRQKRKYNPQFDKAEQQHRAKVAIIQKKRDTLERQAEAEDARWENQRKRLNSARTRIR
jgi:hypothetical protein